MSILAIETVADGVRSCKDAEVQKKPGARRYSDQVLILVLIVVAVGCYANSLLGAFVYDDEQQILQNPYVKSWDYLQQILGTTVWSFVGAAGATNYYRPLMTFTFLVLWKLFGGIPFGFHLFNVALHAAVVVMVFAAGKRLWGDRRVGFVAAALFAIHPVHTEVVDWIAAVPELEVTFFVLVSWWCYLQVDGREWKFTFGSVAAFGLALFSKEPALMFAAVAVVFEQFVRAENRAASLRGKFWRYAPLCAVAGAYLLLRIALFGKLAPVLQHASITWPQAVYSGFALVGGYAKYLVWPAPLSAFHVFHVISSLADARVLAGVAVMTGATLCAAALRKQEPAAGLCIFWTGIFLAPMLNARWMAANVFTERYLYLPSVGFCWLAAWAGIRVWDRCTDFPVRRRVLIVATAALPAVCVIAVLARNPVWGSDMALYTRTLQTNPDAAVIRSNLGALYFDRGDLQRAGAEWEQALVEKPDNVVTMNALGILYTRQNRFMEAAEMFARVQAAKPLWGDGHYSHAQLLEKRGDLPGALREYEEGVRLAPLSAAAHRFYGEALLTKGDTEAAVQELRRSVELDDSLEARNALAGIYLREGRIDLAEPLLREIAEKLPYDSAAHFSLGKILEQQGRKPEARREYEAGLASDPGNAEAKAALQRLQQK